MIDKRKKAVIKWMKLSGILHYEVYGGYEYGLVIKPCVCDDVFVEEFDLVDYLYRLDGEKVKITIKKVE